VFGLLVLVTVVALPEKVAARYLVLPHRGVLAAGTLAFAVEALYANLARPLGYPSPRTLDSLGFAALLFSFGYVALQMVVDRERRLLSIESELAVARRLQLSILPAVTPELSDVRVAAAYEPMTAVAGDFYEFLPVDRHRAGFLVADVSGHGVPAALIASMIKVAVQSVAASARDPAELLLRLRSALHGHLRGQYVTAAYLWLDTEAGTARYAAAGHPPLLLWRAAEGRLRRIESNGILFGVEADSPYPACEIAVAPGDRLLLYTDGLTEPENAAGEPFGESRLERVLRELGSSPAEEVPRSLLAAVGAWRPASVPQQDDITLLVIDVLG
jgi:sigma-B regulation protein RsbU (phosphoserine phosphatase)